MPIRTTVSRIAQRGAVTVPPENAKALDNLVPSDDDLNEQERQEALANSAADQEDHEEQAETAVDTALPRGHAELPARTRRPRGPNKPKDAVKIALQATPAVGETDSAPQLRAKIKETENLIREARERHTTEMKALKTTYAELHSALFDHVK
jgi:hypothetical protein